MMTEQRTGEFDNECYCEAMLINHVSTGMLVLGDIPSQPFPKRLLLRDDPIRPGTRPP